MELVTYSDVIAKSGKEKEFRFGVSELMVQTCHLHWRVAGSCHENSVIVSPQWLESTKSLRLNASFGGWMPRTSFRTVASDVKTLSLHGSSFVLRSRTGEPAFEHQIYADDPRA